MHKIPAFSEICEVNLLTRFTKFTKHFPRASTNHLLLQHQTSNSARPLQPSDKSSRLRASLCVQPAMAETLQLSLSPSPTDIPSALVFHPHTPTSLLVSSWDSTLRYYTISTNPSAQLISHYNH